MKNSKGITLIALIITIIVLLILAVVAINSVNNTGIIQYAQNSADEYKSGMQKENSVLVDYEAEINNILESMNVSKKYHNYTVKDLSQVDLESLLGEYEHKLIFITDEKQSQIFFVIRTSDEFLGFIFTENIESEPTIAYYYNFVDNEWYDINENELNEIPEIIFKNGYILSAEQIKELTGTEFNLFSEEIIDSLFTITSIE